MQDYVVNCIQEKRNDRNRRRKVILWLSLLSVIVAGIVFWQLSVTGVTMSKTLLCDKTEHTHSSECYTLICENADAGHEHGDGCYELTCEVPEHTHDADCYEVSLEDEAKDWTISASFVESKPSDDGSSIDWVYKNSESWNAGTETSVTEDGKEIVADWIDYRYDKTKSNGKNKSVSVRIRFKYSGAIESFGEKELKIEVPNLMYGCGKQQYYATEITLNSDSLFRFEDGSLSQKCDYNYWGHGVKESVISAIETLTLTNYKAVGEAKELQGYFDITYELASGKEHDSGFCEEPTSNYADECTHTNVSRIDNIRFFRKLPTEYNKNGNDYGFVGNYASGTDGSGLSLSFVRRYIHPWCRESLGIKVDHDNSLINYGARKRISEQRTELSAEKIASDYSWITWNLDAFKGWSYGGANQLESDCDSKPETSTTYRLLDGHKRYYYTSDNGLMIFSTSNLTTGGSFIMNLDIELLEPFPKSCIVAKENGDILEPKKNADGTYLEDDGGNYIYSLTLSQLKREGNSHYKGSILVGYPKASFVYNDDGSAKTENERIVTNRAKLKAIGGDGKDYSKYFDNDAILPIDQSGTGSGSFYYNFKKSNDWNNSLNGVITGGFSDSRYVIGVSLNNVPKADGVDVIIVDEDFCIKRDAKGQKLTELSDEEHRISVLTIPAFTDQNGVAVYTDVTVELKYPDGSTKSETYNNQKSSYSRIWYGNDMPSGFAITLSDLHDDIPNTYITMRAGISYTDEVIEKINGTGFDYNAGSAILLTNSARISIKNHATGDYYTKGIQDADFYLDSKKEVTHNGWHYWEIDSGKVERGEKTDYIRVYSQAQMFFRLLQKWSNASALCTDSFSDAKDGYFLNTYTLKWSGKNKAPSDIGECCPLSIELYKSKSWDNAWKNSIAAKNDDGTYKNPGVMYRKAVMFDLLPLGVELMQNEEQIKESASVSFTPLFYKALRISDGEELSKEQITKLILQSVDVKFTKNYNNTGRTLVTASFDVGEGNEFAVIVNSNELKGDVINFTLDINWRVGMDAVIQNGYQSGGIKNKVTYSNCEKGNMVSYSSKDPDVLDETIRSEITAWEHTIMTTHTCKLTYAGAMTQGILNQVRTSRLETYLPDKADEARQTDLDADYGYQVRLAVLSSKITNAKFTDTLECNVMDSEYGADEWSGKLSCIDMSNFSGSLGTDVPTAVFADSETGRQTALDWDADNMRFTVPEGKELGSGTLTIDLGNAQLLPNRYYSYFIHLNAPSEHCDGLTSNNAKISYQKLNNDVADSEVFNLTSNRVFTKLGYSLEKTGLQVEKAWDTGNAEVVELPESISFELLQNGKSIKSGTLTAADNWKSVITDLPAYNQDNGEKYEYTVKENTIEGYVTSVEQLSEPNADGYPIIRITNVLIGRDYALKLIKTDDHGNRLEGAEFKLIDSSGTVVAKGTTDKNGELMLSASGKLLVGQAYKLAETKAPNGYKPLYSNEIAFTVSKTGEPLTVEYDAKDKIESSWDTDDTLVITVENKIQYELPESGGIGTYPFVIGGLLLMAAPMIYIYVRRKERGTVD